MANNTTLAAQLGAKLQAQNLMLVLAESCTGGMVSQFITSIPGCSAWFDRAYITYSNQSKIDLLNVSSQTLQQYGAVSEQVAIEMASGAIDACQSTQHSSNLNSSNLKRADLTSAVLTPTNLENNKVNLNNFIAASITGIAGPNLKLNRPNNKLANHSLIDLPIDTTVEKPVGLVCFAFAVNNQISAFTQHFEGTRRQIRLQATAYVFSQLIHLIRAAD